MKGETRLHQGRLSEREEASTLIRSAVFSNGLKSCGADRKTEFGRIKAKTTRGDECGTSQQAEGPVLGSIVS